VKPRYDPRVFLALTLSRTTQARLGEAQSELRTYLASWHFIPEVNFHMTLRFIGEIPEESIPPICSACAALATQHHPVVLHWNRMDFFGAPHSARVLFAAAEDHHGLSELAYALAAATPGADEARPFHPHITLAKARRQMDRSLVQMNANMLRRLRELGRIGPNPVEVDFTTVHREFVLMETIWIGRAVEYQVRERFHFAEEPES
jgi:2'-5' RNA ligase